jgi:hypothetical protein
MEVKMNPNSENPLLRKARVPGETFQIPSGGLFYSDGELDETVVNGELYVYPMTALDEIVIKTPDMLFSGKAVQDIFNRCIPQVVKPLRLLAKDVDYLLICLRSISFGDEVTVLHTHDCKDAKEHQYVVSINDFIQRVRRLDSKLLSKEYETKLRDGTTILISPLRYDAIIDMMTAMDPENDISTEELHELSSKQMSQVISKVVTVDQNGDSVEVHKPEWIHEWIKTLTLPDLKDIRKAINSLSEWGADTSFERDCPDCGDKTKIVTPLNPMNFFT